MALRADLNGMNAPCLPSEFASAGPKPRRRTVAVAVGSVMVGGGHPIVVQSMTNTDTADIEATVRQVAALWRAGSEIVRITVDRDVAAAAVPHLRAYINSTFSLKSGEFPHAMKF